MKQERNMPPSPVPQEKAKEHALFAVQTFWIGEARGFRDLGSTQIEKEPIIIHDLNGQVLFYEYSVMAGEKSLGLVKASASKTIGSSVPQIQVTPRMWDPVQAMKMAKDRAKEYYPKAKIDSAEFVCYSYPKIGVSVKVEDPNNGEGNLIFDVASFSLVEDFGPSGKDGFASWSFYNDIALPQAAEREKRWNTIDKEMMSVKEAVDRMMSDENAKGKRSAMKIDLARAYRDAVNKEGGVARPIGPGDPIIIKPTEKIIQYSPHCKNHSCYSLTAQQKDDYCAVATGQMILDFYRYYYSQDEIATAMSYSPGGCGQDGQIAGYKSLSRNCLDASVDYSATWSEAAGEIDANRPLKSGISGHARACFGWKAANIWIINQPRPQWLYILDPWPPNADLCKGGAIYWEDWYSITHTNFIYVRQRTTPCK
jgi:hypothetical protein